MKLKNRKVSLTYSNFRYVHFCPIVERLAHYLLVYKEISFESVDIVIHYGGLPLKEMPDTQELLWDRENQLVLYCGQFLLRCMSWKVPQAKLVFVGRELQDSPLSFWMTCFDHSLSVPYNIGSPGFLDTLPLRGFIDSWQSRMPEMVSHESPHLLQRTGRRIVGWTRCLPPHQWW